MFHFGSGLGLLQSLARKVVCDLGEVEHRHFPDGEIYVRLLTPVEGRDVILLASLDDPNDKALTLLFAADAARKRSPKSGVVTLPTQATARPPAARIA